MNARSFAALGALALISSISLSASAFCRATTCDPSKVNCTRDTESCLTQGKPLFWASSCVQVYVQADGSPSQGLDFATAKNSVSRAFGAWLAADCGSGSPLIDVQVLGPITCDQSEYNQTQKNANIVMFRDDSWPYKGGEDALAFTHLQFDANTGELWDADLEINSFEYQFSTGEPVTQNDLDSMLTHEVGHMLGLAHTLVKDATMYAQYDKGTDSLRTLALDDVTGICAMYPPDRVPERTSCSPRHGFSDVCSAEQPPNSATNEGTDNDVPQDNGIPTSKGCAFAANEPGSLIPILLALGAATHLGRRRRARHQFVSCDTDNGQR